MWMCAQVKQSFMILSTRCHATWWDMRVQKEAGRGTPPGPVPALTDFTPMHRRPNYSKRLPSSPPDLLRRLLLLGRLPKPWLRPMPAKVSLPFAPPQQHSRPPPAPASRCKQVHPPQETPGFAGALGGSSLRRLGSAPWRLSALPWGPAD